MNLGQLQWSQQEMIGAPLHWSGGEDGQKLIYLRCTCEAKLIGLHVRIDLRTKGE